MSWLNKQTGITSLSLITDRSYGTNIETQDFVELAELTELQSFAWRRLSKFAFCQSIASFISTNGEQLKSLVLDLIDWTTPGEICFLGVGHSRTNPTMVQENHLAGKHLSIQKGEKKEMLPSLEHLSLSAVSFKSFKVELNPTLCMNKLRTLKLRNCPHSIGLLEVLSGSDRSTVLRSFELLIDEFCMRMEGRRMDPCDDAVARFLKSFHGLEDIFLSLRIDQTGVIGVL